MSFTQLLTILKTLPPSSLQSINQGMSHNLLLDYFHSWLCSSQLYQTFDLVLLLSHGHSLYCGPGSFAPVEYLAHSNAGVPAYKQGYNIADYLLEVASDAPVALYQASPPVNGHSTPDHGSLDATEKGVTDRKAAAPMSRNKSAISTSYATTFLTQLQVVFGREWKILKR
jgi:hypothetical protein